MEAVIKNMVMQSCLNDKLKQEEAGFVEFKSRLDIDLDEKILVLDWDMFKEMKKVYKKADGFHLLYVKGLWELNKFSNPIMTFEQFKKSFN